MPRAETCFCLILVNGNILGDVENLIKKRGVVASIKVAHGLYTPKGAENVSEMIFAQ